MGLRLTEGEKSFLVAAVQTDDPAALARQYRKLVLLGEERSKRAVTMAIGRLLEREDALGFMTALEERMAIERELAAGSVATAAFDEAEALAQLNQAKIEGLTVVLRRRTASVLANPDKSANDVAKLAEAAQRVGAHSSPGSRMTDAERRKKVAAENPDMLEVPTLDDLPAPIGDA